MNAARLAGFLLALLAAPPALATLVADAAQPIAGVRMTGATGSVDIAPADGDGFRPVHFGPGPTPAGSALAFRRESGVWNWAAVRGLRLHVQNAMAWPVTVQMAIVDRHGGTLSATIGLPPGGPLTLTLPLTATEPHRWGMRAGPPPPWTRDKTPVAVALSTQGRIDTAAIREIRIGIPTPDARQTLRIGKLFLPPPEADDERDAYAGIVDRYGQYRRADWPERFNGHGDAAFAADLRARDEALAAALAAANPAGNAVGHSAAIPAGTAPSLDAWGGLLGRSPLRLADQPTGQPGFFRTARVRQANGQLRHLLLTPDGNPFFSLGVNAVQLANSQTFVEGRGFMFDELPSARFRGRQDSRDVLPASAGAQRGRGFGHGETADFYQANLVRRDGEAWPQRWVLRSRDRLRAWGFNTLGGWSDDRVTRPADPADRTGTPGKAHGKTASLAWTAIVHVDGDFARLSDGHDWWAGIPDPFDPAFAAALDAAIARASAGLRDDRALIGYFVDNELGWGNGAAVDPGQRYALALAALAGDAADPQAHAKRAFVALLRERHGHDITRLNAAWGSRYRDWQAIDGPLAQSLPDGRQPGVAADLSALLAAHAERYYRLVAETLARHAPNHLYLGSRFASRTPEAVAACARWCDVVSFNLYLPSLAAGFETEAFRQLGKPALLTEFHFGSSDRGPFWPGVMPVASEAERGPAYRRMLDSVLDNPDFVGAHWFQYLDQAVTGRWLDGENGHLGLVSITDAPWHDFVLAVAATHRDVQRRLWQALGP